AIVLGLVASLVIFSTSSYPKMSSEAGIIDATQAALSSNPIKLHGEWEFYWQELLSPADIQLRLADGKTPDRWITLPSAWLGYRIDDQQLKGTGYATFRLTIKLSEQDRHERLALRLPSIFHAYKLWVNGEQLAAVGEVGQDRGSVKPHIA